MRKVRRAKSRLGGPRAGSGAVHVQGNAEKSNGRSEETETRTIPLSIAVREAVGIELRY